MNKRFVAATTMMAMFVTSAAAATAYQKSITANYGISLEINGNKANLTDVNGKTVEPFTYNGTTYVPIRAVAENMGSYVGYDAKLLSCIKTIPRQSFLRIRLRKPANICTALLMLFIRLVPLDAIT